MTPRPTAFLIILAAIACAPGPAAGQDKYPSKPIQMIVPLSPGTSTDIVARTFADRMSERLGQPVLVQNKQGAGGTIAAQAVSKSAPDGYTILMVNSQHAINPLVFSKLPFDTLRDFYGLALIGESPSVVVVAPQLGARTLKEFIALAKQRPDSIHYASSGIGSQTHLAGAYFASRAGISLVHVPYKSSSDVVADLLTGRVQATFVPALFLLSPIKSGKLLALGVAAPEAMRVPLEAPSVGEAGVPGFEYATWFGFVAPAKVPAPILERLAHTIRDIAGEKEVVDKFHTQGIMPRVLTLGQFDAHIKAEIDKLAPVVKAAAIRAE
jgi:tripartite-type tricarboxylate transporter receptor subunit TctC